MHFGRVDSEVSEIAVGEAIDLGRAIVELLRRFEHAMCDRRVVDEGELRLDAPGQQDSWATLFHSERSS